MPPTGSATPHGRLLAGEAGALAGVSGTTIGQWARRGYIRSSQSGADAEPRVYSVEDVAEAAIVAELLARGVSHADVHAAVDRLEEYGTWPLGQAQLATTPEDGHVRIALREAGEWLVLGPRGWQAIAAGHEPADVRLRLPRAAGTPDPSPPRSSPGRP